MRILIALQFLTVIPVRIARRFGSAEMAASMVYFPLIGLLLGLILAALNAAVSSALPGLVTGVILTGTLAALTGGLHIDGLADTADAFFSGKDVSGKLKIMKDSRIGAMGAAAVCLALILKSSLFASLNPAIAFGGLLLAPAAGRCCLLLPALAFRYGRNKGTGKAFISLVSARTVVAAFGATLLLSFGILGIPGGISLIFAGVASLGVGRIISKSIGGITGDALGAVNEMAELVFLACLVILH